MPGHVARESWIVWQGISFDDGQVFGCVMGEGRAGCSGISRLASVVRAGRAAALVNLEHLRDEEGAGARDLRPDDARIDGALQRGDVVLGEIDEDAFETVDLARRVDAVAGQARSSPTRAGADGRWDQQVHLDVDVERR